MLETSKRGTFSLCFSFSWILQNYLTFGVRFKPWTAGPSFFNGVFFESLGWEFECIHDVQRFQLNNGALFHFSLQKSEKLVLKLCISLENKNKVSMPPSCKSSKNNFKLWEIAQLRSMRVHASTVMLGKNGTFICELIMGRYTCLHNTQKQLKITSYGRNKSFLEFYLVYNSVCLKWCSVINPKWRLHSFLTLLHIYNAFQSCGGKRRKNLRRNAMFLCHGCVYRNEKYLRWGNGKRTKQTRMLQSWWKSGRHEAQPYLHH